MASSDYLDSILRSQGQSKVTGRGALNPSQVEAAFRGELAARYESDVSRTKEAFQESATTRGLDISQQGADTQKQSMLNAKEATDAQIAAGKQQTIVSGVGAVGQAAIGGALVKKAFFDAGTKAGGETITAGTTSTGTSAGTMPVQTPVVDAAGNVAGTTATGEALVAGGGVGAGEAGIGAAGVAGATEAAAGVTEVAGGEGLVSTIIEVAPEAAAAWVLCSELVRQGKLEQAIVDDEWSYIREIITDEEYSGYRVIADPLVDLMQESVLATRILTPFIRAFAYEMASRVNPKIKGNDLGKIILFIGIPLCRAASYFSGGALCHIQ